MSVGPASPLLANVHCDASYSTDSKIHKCNKAQVLHSSQNFKDESVTETDFENLCTFCRHTLTWTTREPSIY